MPRTWSTEGSFCVPRRGHTRVMQRRVTCERKLSPTFPNSTSSHCSSLNHHIIMSMTFMVRRQIEALIPSIPSSILPSWLKPIIDCLIGLVVFGVCTSAYKAGRTRFGSWTSIRKGNVHQREGNNADEQYSFLRRRSSQEALITGYLHMSIKMPMSRANSEIGSFRLRTRTVNNEVIRTHYDRPNREDQSRNPNLRRGVKGVS
jgi:hypothetical protein